MKRTHLQVCALAVVLCAVGAISANSARGDAPDTTLKDIAGYREWARVTVTPLEIKDWSPAG